MIVSQNSDTSCGVPSAAVHVDQMIAEMQPNENMLEQRRC